MTTEQLLNIKTADKLVSQGIVEVLVTYLDKSTKLFTLEDWTIFREGIIKNLYNKDLCLIDFIKA